MNEEAKNEVRSEEKKVDNTSALGRFLELPDVNSMEKEIDFGGRIGKLTIRPLSRTKFSNLNKKATVNGEVKNGLLNLLVVKEQVINPNFNDASFLSKVGCQTAEEFIDKKLFAGEIAVIASEIVDESGFSLEVNPHIEEAKN